MAKELELNSFLIKFTQLCNAGLEAKLQLNCKNGHASVSLEVMLWPLQSTSNMSLGGVSSSFKQKRKGRRHINVAKNHVEMLQSNLLLMVIQ